MSNYSIKGGTFEGKPCRKCGATLRYASPRRRCVACWRARDRARRPKKPETPDERMRRLSTPYATARFIKRTLTWVELCEAQESDLL